MTSAAKCRRRGSRGSIAIPSGTLDLETVARGFVRNSLGTPLKPSARNADPAPDSPAKGVCDSTRLSAPPPCIFPTTA